MCGKRISNTKKKNITGSFKFFLKKCLRFSQNGAMSPEFHNFHFALVSFSHPKQLRESIQYYEKVMGYDYLGYQSTKLPSLLTQELHWALMVTRGSTCPKLGQMSTCQMLPNNKWGLVYFVCWGLWTPMSLSCGSPLGSISNNQASFIPSPHGQGADPETSIMARSGLGELDTFRASKNAEGTWPSDTRPFGDGCGTQKQGKWSNLGEWIQMCLAWELNLGEMRMKWRKRYSEASQAA